MEKYFQLCPDGGVDNETLEVRFGKKLRYLKNFALVLP